jgi:hypothetical protein
MGLDSQFKQYLQADFPDVIATSTPAVPAALICDCMCLLHQWRAGEGSTLTSLADYVWRHSAAGSSPTTALVLCFDRQVDTPRPKELEHARRAPCAKPLSKQEVEAGLADDLLPHPWADAMADRDVRSCVVEALANRLASYFAGCNGALRKLIVHGTEAAAHAYTKGKHMTCEVTAEARMLGEGDVAMVYWMRRLRKHSNGDIIIHTVDTDLVRRASVACP